MGKKSAIALSSKNAIARPNLSAFIWVHLPTSAVKKISIPLTIIKNIKSQIIKKCSDYPKPNSKSSKNAPANSNTATSNYSPPPPPQNTKKNSHGEATFTY
jgi:hypothetical protein